MNEDLKDLLYTVRSVINRAQIKERRALEEVCGCDHTMGTNQLKKYQDRVSIVVKYGKEI